MDRTSTDADLQGKVALITGAANPNGIGMGAAMRLAAMGCSIAVTDLSVRLAELDGNAGSLTEQFSIDAIAVPIDVADRESVRIGIASVVERLGRLDVVVNNAGTVFGAPSPLHEYDEGEWSRTIDINLNGTLRVTTEAVAAMTDGGSIINISSMAGKVGAPSNGAYSVSKAAIIMLTQVMAVELASSGVRVNAICPGLIDTDLQRLNVALKAHVSGIDIDLAEQRMLDAVPLGRMGTIYEVGDLCAYLASGRSSYVTGQAININGGIPTAN